MNAILSRWLLLLLYVLSGEPLSAASMVYSFRIAQITKQPLAEKTGNQRYDVIALIFNQHRKKHTDVSQKFAGGLGSFIYDFEPYYFRTDFAVAHVHEAACGKTTFSGTETDDLLFTLGRNFTINKRTTVTLSGLFGVPTHKIYRLQHADFGENQVGLGLQFDGSYELHHTAALLYGTRYIYFVPRTACDSLRQKHTFTIGNVADLLFAYKNNWGQHGLEFGYTARFQFGAHITPNIDDLVQQTNYTRSSFYGVYKYKFFINKVTNRLLFNISYGFDHKPKCFGNKRIITLWLAWSINF